MIFRYARHTTDLGKIEKFYTDVIGLEKLGSFENHENYDGLFLGHKNADWHLEFTTSDEKPKSQFDEDDILVFYVNSDIELTSIKKRLVNKTIKPEVPKNPYWITHGVMISDPDNFKIVFSIKQLHLNANDELTRLVRRKHIEHWSELIQFVKNMPYGRNTNREDLSLVIKENRGTCSSKHSFLKMVADLNSFNNVKLILGMYRMNPLNTPKIENTISKVGLEYLPEAHCYLKLNNQRIDITDRHSDIEYLKSDIMEEMEIEAEQVAIFKVGYHKKYLQKWMRGSNINMDFDEIWKIRRQCIEKLAQ